MPRAQGAMRTKAILLIRVGRGRWRCPRWPSRPAPPQRRRAAPTIRTGARRTLSRGDTVASSRDAGGRTKAQSGSRRRQPRAAGTRRSNIRAGRGAIRGRSAASIRPNSGLATTRGAAPAGVPVEPDAADGHAARLALGAYRAARCAARQGPGAAQRQPGRLGRRTRLAAAADGRGRRRADAGRRRRCRPLHAEDVPGRRCRARWPMPTRRPVPARRTGFAKYDAGIRGSSRRCAHRLPASRKAPRRRSTRRAATDGSAASTWRWPRRSSAPAPNGRAVTIEWEPVDHLTSWRFGLATATGASARSADESAHAATARMAGAGALADRATAAALGDDRRRAWRLLIADDGRPLFGDLRFDRPGDLGDATPGSCGRRSSARIPSAGSRRSASCSAPARSCKGGCAGPGRAGGDAGRARRELAKDAPDLISAMLAGGYDQAAARWIPAVNGMDDEDSDRCWAMLALAAPELADVGTGRINGFIRRDKSATSAQRLARRGPRRAWAGSAPTPPIAQPPLRPRSRPHDQLDPDDRRAGGARARRHGAGADRYGLPDATSWIRSRRPISTMRSRP